MSKKFSYFNISILKISAYSIISILVAMFFSIIDNTLIKQNAILPVIFYDEMCLVIWQVQATISAIIVALIALTMPRAAERYFGLEVKEILSLKKNWSFGLNFWEMNLFTLILNATTYVSILFNSLFATTIIGLCSLLYVIHITYISFRTSIDSLYLRESAQKIVDKLLLEVIMEKESYERYYNQDIFRPNDKQTELNAILENIFESVTQEIGKRKIDVYQSEDMDFVYKVFRTYNDKELKGMRDYLISLFYRAEQKAVFEELDDLAFQFCRWVANDKYPAYLHQGIEVMFVGINKGYIKKDIVDSFADWVKTQSIQSLDNNILMITTTAKLALKYGYIEFSRKIIQGILGGSDYSNCQLKVCSLHLIAAYSYYLSVKEPLYSREYGVERQSLIKSQIKDVIFEDSSDTFAEYIMKQRKCILGISQMLNQNSKSNFNMHSYEIITVGKLSQCI